jgi:hypothetical protein
MRGDQRPEIDLEALERAAQVMQPYQPPRHHVLASRMLQTVIILEILFVLLSYATCFFGIDPNWLTRTAGIPARLGTLVVYGAPGLFIAILAILGAILADSNGRRRWFVGACILGAVWGLAGVFATIVDLL